MFTGIAESILHVAPAGGYTNEWVFEMDLLFIPEVAPLRERADFADLLDALGIADYWLERGCSWTVNGAVCDAA